MSSQHSHNSSQSNWVFNYCKYPNIHHSKLTTHRIPHVSMAHSVCCGAARGFLGFAAGAATGLLLPSPLLLLLLLSLLRLLRLLLLLPRHGQTPPRRSRPPQRRHVTEVAAPAGGRRGGGSSAS
jgi:hypothetical protein